jgi:hypothetical protein
VEPRFDPLSERNRPQNRWHVYWGRRFAKIREEVEQNRRGEFTVPTWVLGLILLVLVGAIVAIVVLSPGYG